MTKAYCKRGHELFEENTLRANPSGVRCRACNRALSHCNNERNRHGNILDLDTVADEKYAAIKTTLNKMK